MDAGVLLTDSAGVTGLAGVGLEDEKKLEDG